MATFLIRRTLSHDKNSSGIHAVLVSAANEAAARALAAANAPTGETKIPSTWEATQVAATDLPGNMNPTFFEGDAILPGERTRGS